MSTKSFNDVMSFRDRVDRKWNPIDAQSQEEYYEDENNYSGTPADDDGSDILM